MVKLFKTRRFLAFAVVVVLIFMKQVYVWENVSYVFKNMQVSICSELLFGITQQIWMINKEVKKKKFEFMVKIIFGLKLDLYICG